MIAVGCYSNTFNIPGVKEHAFFLKEIIHAFQIRQKIIDSFEKANEPTTSESDKQKLVGTSCIWESYQDSFILQLLEVALPVSNSGNCSHSFDLF